MTPEDARDELVQLQARLDDVRRRLHDDPSTHTATPVAQLGRQSLWIYPACLLLAIAGFGLIIAATSFMGESTTALVVGLAVALVAGVPGGYLLRRALVIADREVRQPVLVLERERLGMLAEVDAVYLALGSQRPADGPDPVALPSHRQPLRWPELMADRFRVGRRPEVALRALHPDASGAIVWYHRHVGDSGMVIVGLVVGLVVSLGVVAVLG